jgi:hypothetical protein
MDVWEEAQEAVGSRKGRRALTLKERQAADPLDKVKHRMNTATDLRDLLEVRFVHAPSSRRYFLSQLHCSIQAGCTPPSSRVLLSLMVG